MRLTGFAGYYRKGAIVRSETGEDMRLPFGYKDLGAVKQPLEAVFGVETVPVVLRIEVMGTDNPFRRNQVLSLPDGAYLVLNSNGVPLSQIGGITITTVEVQKN